MRKQQKCWRSACVPERCLLLDTDTQTACRRFMCVSLTLCAPQISVGERDRLHARLQRNIMRISVFYGVSSVFCLLMRAHFVSVGVSAVPSLPDWCILSTKMEITRGFLKLNHFTETERTSLHQQKCVCKVPGSFNEQKCQICDQIVLLNRIFLMY